MARISAATLACLLLAATATRAARTHRAIEGPWTGALVVAGQADASARASIARSGAKVTGTLAVATGTGVLTVSVRGRVKGRRVAVRAAHTPGVRFRWRGRWDDGTEHWSGPATLTTSAGKTRGQLDLERPGDVFSPECGAFDYFAGEVMPKVVEPICSHCHVPGGLAAAARFRVTAADPTATMLSALELVDATDPALSKILQKPRGETSHGGGVQLTAGSPEDQTLAHWVDLVVSPACGGGQHGGPKTPAELYADNCASCHGADARGNANHPDIHCNRGIADPVRTGRVGETDEMKPFTDLTDQDVADIQGYLIGLCPSDTVTGEELFLGNCATCHGTDGGGKGDRPSIRCATRVSDAVRIGRGDVMQSFPSLYMPDVELGRLENHLDTLCQAAGRTPADLYAGNCSTCHGPTADGGTNALGVRGPSVACTEIGDYLEKVRLGSGNMPSFPALSDTDIAAIRAWVFTGFCVNP